ncbi:HD domain-containing protein [Nocardia sp. BMG111209]|uniref:HD domain-containing protein n=1 Tax=Nocardia sp. BMG111209 TaxID=1160137 RepID=UPI0004754B2F|nr:HD domain-containing protein [Nocardia sp. BMG111209]
MSADALQLPEDPIVAPVLEIVRAEESAAVANHSLRSYLFARLLARHEELVVAERTLFAACVLHDIGLTARGNGNQRFEVDGADAADSLLTPLGVPAAERALIWEAIALHTSGGIAERRGPLAYLTRSGVGIDFGRGSAVITEEQAVAIHAAYPRLAMASSLVDAVVVQAEANPAKAAPYTFAGDLLRERRAGETGLERAAAAGRWGG